MIDPRPTGRTVLVTGGAGGIGAAISRASAAQGARVAVHCLAQDPAPPASRQCAHVTPAAERAEQSTRRLGDDSFAVGADLSGPDAARRPAEAVAQRTGPVDVLVDDAAHCQTPDSIDTLTSDSLERHYRVDAVAPALLTAEAARLRRGQEPLSVSNVGTDAAHASPAGPATAPSGGTSTSPTSARAR